IRDLIVTGSSDVCSSDLGHGSLPGFPFLIHCRLCPDWSSMAVRRMMSPCESPDLTTASRSFREPVCTVCFSKLPLVSSQTKEWRSEEHTSELQSRSDLVCRLLLEKKKTHHSIMTAQQPTTTGPMKSPPSLQMQDIYGLATM